VTLSVPPPAGTFEVVVDVNVAVIPAYVIVPDPVGLVTALPELVRTIVHVDALAEHEIEVTETCAVVAPELKIPNTKPAIATAAMRVTAMMSTVAMIGDMAFLFIFLNWTILFLGRTWPTV
jgi:hypothetical protein